MSKASRPVTIIAAQPAAEYGPFLDDNGFLDTMREALAHGSPRPASSVVDVVDAISDATAGHTEPLAVQIVGHATSGQMMLGGSYLADSTKHREWPYFVIDTTPSPLGFLARHTGRIAELTLVGCNVGTASPSWPVNGRGLLYCLCELLKCSVRGAISTVSPNDFDVSGRYAGPVACWDWSELAPPRFSTTAS